MKNGLFKWSKHTCLSKKRPKFTFQLPISQISDNFVKIAILIFGNVKKKQRTKALFLEEATKRSFLGFCDSSNHMAKATVNIHNLCRNAG
jgi:hypothetical protein